MKVGVSVNGHWHDVELPDPRADVRQPEPGVYSVLLDGRVYEARVEPGAVVVNGRRFEIEVRDPRTWTGARRAAGHARAEQVTAPMPGKVVRVLVGVGDSVEAGQGLLVVEAMKMQNEMKSSKAGRVASLAAREGAAVAAGEVLATIE